MKSNNIRTKVFLWNDETKTYNETEEKYTLDKIDQCGTLQLVYMDRIYPLKGQDLCSLYPQTNKTTEQVLKECDEFIKNTKQFLKDINTFLDIKDERTKQYLIRNTLIDFQDENVEILEQ